MSVQNNLFYEDSKSIRLFLRILTVLFYIGAIFGLFSIILYRWIAPEELLKYYKPSGEDVIITILCLVFAVSLSIYLVKGTSLNYYFLVNDKEIKFCVKNKLYTYSVLDLKCYKFTKRYLGYVECKLVLAENKEILVPIKNTDQLKNVLNEFIFKNK